MLLPRYVRCVDGRYEWDAKIVVNDHRDDNLMLKNVFGGKIISSNIYPLIYDNEDDIGYRSIPFYKRALIDHRIYEELADEFKVYFVIGLRDLFIASELNLLNDQEKELLKKFIAIIDSNVMSININGLNVTPYPSRSNIMVRYIEKIQLDDITKQYFAENSIGLIMVFINPEELSYHNFENIIPLDNYITNDLKFTIDNVHKYDEKDIYTFDITGNNILLKLNDMNMYVPPLNDTSRGGKRFIFMSKILSKSLTESIKESNKFEVFEFVNYVFRYNKFSPGDNKFINHYDTPYYNSNKKHYSTHTLLIYLTGGKGNPALKIDDVCINSIKGLTGIIFNQKYEHEGKCFIDNDKIFLRSELICRYETLDHEPDLAKIFNMSCYMTKQSIFNNELKKYVNDSFNHVAKLRYKINANVFVPQLLHKLYEGINFITNGNDYWFLNKHDPKLCAVIIMLDYFNGIYNNKIFNKETTTTIIHESIDIPSFLMRHDKEGYKDNNERNGMEKYNYRLETLDINSEYDHICCTFHNGSDYSPRESSGVCRVYNEGVEKFNKKCSEYSMIIMNEKVSIDVDDIQVLEDKIIFKKQGLIPSVNFAACQGLKIGPTDFIQNDTKDIIGLKLPYISYITTPPIHHLTIDMFNNDFIFTEKTQITIPKILDYPNITSDPSDYW